MRQVHQITELATQAAALIPEPPADALSYVAWRELVWDTGRRLAELSRECPVHPALTPTDPSDEIDEFSAHLLRLAELFRQVPADEPGFRSCAAG